MSVLSFMCRKHCRRKPRRGWRLLEKIMVCWAFLQYKWWELMESKCHRSENIWRHISLLQTWHNVWLHLWKYFMHFLFLRLVLLQVNNTLFYSWFSLDFCRYLFFTDIHKKTSGHYDWPRLALGQFDKIC